MAMKKTKLPPILEALSDGFGLPDVLEAPYIFNAF